MDIRDVPLYISNYIYFAEVSQKTESLQAGGFVHSGGGTDWVKASEIAEKDNLWTVAVRC